MPDTPNEHADLALRLLGELDDASAPVPDGVVKISDDMSVIYGDIPVDGAVILAEFDSYEKARTVLYQLATEWLDNTDRSARPAIAGLPCDGGNPPGHRQQAASVRGRE